MKKIFVVVLLAVLFIPLISSAITVDSNAGMLCLYTTVNQDKGIVFGLAYNLFILIFVLSIIILGIVAIINRRAKKNLPIEPQQTTEIQKNKINKFNKWRKILITIIILSIVLGGISYSIYYSQQEDWRIESQEMRDAGCTNV